MTETQSDTLIAFTAFRDEIDEHVGKEEILENEISNKQFQNDRRERIIKTSRDITSLSKKMIFSLHRITKNPPDKVFKEALIKKGEIRKLFTESLGNEINSENFYRYRKSLSPGIQEFIEGLCFLEYLENKKLFTFSQAQENINPLILTPDDYLLGVSDLTGEIMRYAINSIGISKHNQAKEACEFLRDLRRNFQLVTSNIYGLGKKLDVMKVCVERVEDACYAIQIRGSEYPPELFSDILQQMNRKEGNFKDDDT